MAKVIAIANQKGGVGKTSTTVNLGAGLIRQGYDVLLIDLDSQANLTMALGFQNPDDMDFTVSNVLYKGIRFIDSSYNNKFRLPDGGKIQITTPSGEKITETCRYIDEYHVEVGRWLYHICEFAERMEASGAKVEPVSPVMNKTREKGVAR